MNSITENPITAETTTDTGDLIPVFTTEIGGISQLAVDARELHRFLDVKRDYSTWIKRRIQECGLVENEDYLLTKIGEQLPSGTKYRFDYHLTLEVAKELSMIERNAQGRMVRKYFIECEKQLHANAQQKSEHKKGDLRIDKQTYKHLELFKTMHERILYLLFKKRDELIGLSGPISEEALWEHVSTLKYAMHSKINRDFTETFPNFNDCDEVTLEMHGFIMNWRPCMAIKYPESSQS